MLTTVQKCRQELRATFDYQQRNYQGYDELVLRIIQRGHERCSMTLQFLGDYAKLKKCVSRTGVTGEWREFKNGHKQFRTKGGAIINWWQSSGTVLFQGQDPGMKFEQGFIASSKGRLKQKGSEHVQDLQEENATLRKLLEYTFVEKAILKRRVSKLKEQLSEER
jgi:hypothetical protein